MEGNGTLMVSIGALVLTSAALMGSPGPSNISATAVGAAFGLRRAAPYVAGLVLGTTVVLITVATGVFALLVSIPWLAPALTTASLAYILVLAVRIARAPPLPLQDPATPAPSFIGGLLFAAANPKAYLAIAAVLAGSRLDVLPPTAEVLLKTAVLALMVVVIHLAWVLAGASLSRVLRDPLGSRVINVVLAGTLVATSVLAVLPR